MIGTTINNINVKDKLKHSFIDVFNKRLETNNENPTQASIKYEVPEDIWKEWGADDLTHQLGYLFLDDIRPDHVIIQAMGDAWMDKNSWEKNNQRLFNGSASTI